MEWKQADRTTFSWKTFQSTSAFLSTVRGTAVPDRIESFLSEGRNGDMIMICSPLIDDPRVVELICSARKRGVIVRMITSLLDQRGRVVTKGWDASQNLKAHHEAVRMLAKSGVLLRSPSTTPHGKMILADGRGAFFGSPNLSPNSLRGKAVECGITIEDPRTLDSFRAAFDVIWTTCRFSMFSGFGSISLQERAPKANDCLQSVWAQEDGVRVWLSRPGGVAAIAAGLAELLEEARFEVILVALSFYDTDLIPLFAPALRGCLERGVRVRTVVRPEHFPIADFPDRSTITLLDAGMELVGVSGLHAKGFVVDEKWCGLHSANFNPYSLCPDRVENHVAVANVELGVCGPSVRGLLSNATEFLLQLANEPTHELAR
jgi:phosphatidylserine/phosphatidylglycerophosphate/cardiolipin synthase-like enzyme